MNFRTILFGFIALLAAGGTAFMIQGWMNSQRAALLASQPKEPPKVAETEVLVAKVNLPTGTLIKPEHLRWQPWPKDNISDAYAVNGKRKQNDFIGAVLRRGIVAGEPITDARVVKPGESGFLAAVLKEGYRATTVPVNATSGIAGFVFPGDRVDLILTHKVVGADEEDKKRTRYVAQTVLEKLRVLAVDQKYDDQTGKPTVAKTATLEVTPKQAEIIAVALELGRISLTLRGLSRPDTGGAEPGAGAPMNVATAAPGDATAAARPTVAKRAGGKSGPIQLYAKRNAPAATTPDEPWPDNDGVPRKKSYSWDSDASAVLPDPAAKADVLTVIRGGKVEIQEIRRPK